MFLYLLRNKYLKRKYNQPFKVTASNQYIAGFAIKSKSK